MKSSLHLPLLCGTAAVLLSTCVAERCFADVVAVDIPATADTFIVSSAPNNNAGGNGWLDVGTDGVFGVRRALLKFDFSSIPAGVKIESATLNLSILKVPSGGGAPSTIDLFRLQKSWNEGVEAGSSGFPAQAGETTWNESAAGSESWTVAGARSDAAATSSGSAAVSSTFAAVISWNNLTNDVQFWVDHPGQNFGWLLMSQSEATPRSVRGFSSKESGAAGPTLHVEYSVAAPPNMPPAVAITTPTNGAVLNAPASVSIAADALDSDGSVMQVQFFDGTAAIGTATMSPFAITASLGTGNHALTAVATDDAGARSTSAVVNVSVITTNFSNPIVARIGKGNITVELKPVADGMVSPLGMAVADDGTGRMFIYDQIGVIWMVTRDGRSPVPVLDVRTRLVPLLGAYDERGLLGLAIHTNFAQHPFLYTYTSEPSNGPADFPSVLPPGATNDHQSVIAEWRMDSVNTNQVDATSRREILRIDEPQANHNGGTLRFGPDGLLYVSLGDGGQANDVGPGHSPGGNGQDTTNILGSVIRIDVEGRASANGQYSVPADNPFAGPGGELQGLPEIYAYGLRNPFNFSFDRSSGQLYLGDVGQNSIEEVDIITRGGNYGWNIKEGTFFFVPSGGYVTNVPTREVPADLIDPIAEYDHDDGSAVIGGFVYRGSALPALSGHYVFGDWGSFAAPSGRLFYLDDSLTIQELRIGLDDRRLGYYVKGFGEDADGELYVFVSKTGPAAGTGAMYKLVPPPSGPLRITSGGLTNGTNFQTTWTGGIGPFAQQRKTKLDEPFCMNELFVPGTSAVTPVRGSSGFFRTADTAHLPAVPLTATLSGANERPTPLSNTATGFGIFSVEGSTLRFTVSYGGLSGPATLAHIHGPAPAGGAGPILIDLKPFSTTPFATKGSFSGAIVLTDTQKAMVLGGLTYVNVHTTANPGGEMRGQIAPVNFQVSLLDEYEVPPTGTGARGFGSLTLIGNQLSFNIAYSGLSGSPTLAHFHGPAAIGQNAPPIIDLAPFNGGSVGSRGIVSGTVTLTPAQLAWFIDGQVYVNFHTDLHPGGELRGQVVPQVTAIPFTAWISGTNERPTALSNTATGLGLFSLEGDKLAFNITYGGLSGTATAAHIHGSAVTTNFAGIQIDLAPFANGPLATDGSFSGTVLLTTNQRNMLLGGQTYFNVHTVGNPGGEARGNITPVLMSAYATGSGERPNPTVSGGSALGLFTLANTQLTMSIVYSGLSGPASAAHIHAPATTAGSASVVIDFSRVNGGAYSSAGVVSGSTNLSPAVLGYLIDGLGYINFHTTRYSGGEIRGQIGH